MYPLFMLQFSLCLTRKVKTAPVRNSLHLAVHSERPLQSPLTFLSHLGKLAGPNRPSALPAWPRSPSRCFAISPASVRALSPISLVRLQAPTHAYQSRQAAGPTDAYQFRQTAGPTDAYQSCQTAGPTDAYQSRQTAGPTDAYQSCQIAGPTDAYQSRQAAGPTVAYQSHRLQAPTDAYQSRRAAGPNRRLSVSSDCRPNRRLSVSSDCRPNRRLSVSSDCRPQPTWCAYQSSDCRPARPRPGSLFWGEDYPELAEQTACSPRSSAHSLLPGPSAKEIVPLNLFNCYFLLCVSLSRLKWSLGENSNWETRPASPHHLITTPDRSQSGPELHAAPANRRPKTPSKVQATLGSSCSSAVLRPTSSPSPPSP
ncbi:uncharacterized protein LOC116708241 [Xiphophorus hellerii]|uniref:uncharacterized protein LOC116708241 n=1 Tax=Xiphophorus hellerii TaxID=8084 RepID=UPI0013B3CB67|nr:uncharacterized protein LOC116708241 [Xiphophorus hellerii]